MSRLLSEATFAELMAAASKRLGRDECLILAQLDDDPSSHKACIYIGDEDVHIHREHIKAHGR